MNSFEKIGKVEIYSRDFVKEISRFWVRRSRILILVDGAIQVLPQPGPQVGNEIAVSSAFGISNVIALLKSFWSGFSSFAVTVATRNGNGAPLPGHDITGFRFSDAELAKFDQVWMFGINPGNVVPDSTDPAEDSRIENQPGANPLSSEELAALAKWMDNGGGVFATGDHHFLGASMCYRVPRVAVMRRWTITDGVPTIGFKTRYDTNRPATPQQAAGTAVIPNQAEQDDVPQRIQWTPYASLKQGYFLFRSRPHPLLCHPKLGPIDVLPDHPHEGLCYDFDDSGWKSSKRDTGFTFAGYSNDHFPTKAGKRPLPQVVATGTTLADPPLQFAKGDQDLRHFPLIAAYDGQQIGSGRVVVDSTWHHWFDMNLMGLEATARATGDRTNIDKIHRYFINVGIYLASAHWRAGQFYGWLKAEQFDHFGQQEVNLTASAIEIGRLTSQYLKPVLGPCWVSEFILDKLVDTDIWVWLKDKLGIPDPCLSCPPFELFEEAVLGEIVRTVYSDMEEMRAQLGKEGQIGRSPLLRGLDKAVDRAAPEGLKAAFEFLSSDLEHARRQASAFTPAKTRPRG